MKPEDVFGSKQVMLHNKVCSKLRRRAIEKWGRDVGSKVSFTQMIEDLLKEVEKKL